MLSLCIVFPLFVHNINNNNNKKNRAMNSLLTQSTPTPAQSLGISSFRTRQRLKEGKADKEDE